MVERLDLSRFEQSYGAKGGALYAYSLGITSARLLGPVAIDSTRIEAGACRDRIDSDQTLRRLRYWPTAASSPSPTSNNTKPKTIPNQKPERVGNQFTRATIAYSLTRIQNASK